MKSVTLKKAALPLSLTLAFLLFSIPAGADAKKFNNVSFGSVRIGQDIDLFMRIHKGYTKSKETTIAKFNADIFDHARIWAPHPAGMSLSSRILSMIPASVVTSEGAKCDAAPRLLFLGHPSISGASANSPLYAYEYNVCDQTGLLNARQMLQRYVTKYGMYDEKDYDRQMIIYNNVKGRYRVGARPFVRKGKPTGLTMTVLDEQVFREVYNAWSGVMRSAWRRSGDLF